VSDPLHLNLCGRVLLVTSRYGITELPRARVFVRAIADVVDHVYPKGRPSLLALEPLVSEQLTMLEAALRAVQNGSGPAKDAVLPVPEEQCIQEEPVPEPEEKSVARRKRKPLQQGESAVVVKSLEEKLRDEREPVQKLLKQDCVHAGLLDKKKAEAMVRSMLGKTPQEAEQNIVEQLRQILQDQVKAAIRRKSGPWCTPLAQEEMRKDIHGARSVKSILMLARQIRKEQLEWKKQNGKGGLRGLFG